MLSLPAALRWTEMLAGVAALVGTLELIATRRSWSERGTWRWSALREGLPWASLLLAERPFLVLLGMRAAASGVLILHPTLAGIAALWATSVLVNLRFRGPYNGGSDHMLIIVLTALLVAAVGAGHDLAPRAAMAWIGVQAVLSYVVAGIAKLRSASWRRGTVLPVLLAIPAYGVPAAARRLVDVPVFARMAAWGVLAFECGVPLALLSGPATLAAIAVAATFHVVNAWVFGLNRFLLVWASTWPAIAALSSMMASR